jgi:hypothetical protein
MQSQLLVVYSGWKICCDVYGMIGIKLQQVCGRARGRGKLGHEKLSEMNERIFIGMAVIGCLVGIMVGTWQYQEEKCFNVGLPFFERKCRTLQGCCGRLQEGCGHYEIVVL